MNRDQFNKKIDSFNDELINLRRHIHAHPELSGLENQPAILISGFLKKIVENKFYINAKNEICKINKRIASSDERVHHMRKLTIYKKTLTLKKIK